MHIYIKINIEKYTDVCLCVHVYISLFTIAVSTFNLWATKEAQVLFKNLKVKKD